MSRSGLFRTVKKFVTLATRAQNQNAALPELLESSQQQAKNLVAP